MAMVDAKVNCNFEESYVNVNHILVTNGSGRDWSHLELVVVAGLIGEVRDFDGIDNGDTGYINIDPDRIIGTTQINITDTFVVGQVVYLKTSAVVANDKIRSTPEVDTVPIGICTYEDSGTSIAYKPFTQRSGGVNDMKVSTYVMDSDHSTLVVVTGLVPLGARIYDVIVESLATVTSATMQLRSNNASPVDITAALVIATDNAIVRAAILTNNVVDSDGLEIIAASSADRGIMTIMWR